MTEGERKKKADFRITEKQRYNYIGFEVFPGQPKDLFKSDAEKDKIVKELQARRESSDTLRDDCTLLEERVSFSERIILAVASFVLIAGLMLPWYSAYTVVPIESSEVTIVPIGDTLDTPALTNDSLAKTDDSNMALSEGQLEDIPNSQIALDEQSPVEQTQQADGVSPESSVKSYQGESSNEEIITGRQFTKRTTKEYTYLSGLGAFLSLGSIGTYMFSSGTVLILTAVLLIFYGLLCIFLSILNFYSLFGLKGTPDETALKMKQYLRYNWLPSILFIAVMFLSFFGSEYGFDTTEVFTSIGKAYGPGIFLGTLSWGVFISLAASIMVAVKGIEI